MARPRCRRSRRIVSVSSHPDASDPFDDKIELLRAHVLVQRVGALGWQTPKPRSQQLASRPLEVICVRNAHQIRRTPPELIGRNQLITFNSFHIPSNREKGLPYTASLPKERIARHATLSSSISRSYEQPVCVQYTEFRDCAPLDIRPKQFPRTSLFRLAPSFFHLENKARPGWVTPPTGHFPLGRIPLLPQGDHRFPVLSLQAPSAG